MISPIYGLAAFMVALTGLPGTAAEAQSPPSYYVMRHLESRGTGKDERLNEVGANNAQRLAQRFETHPPAAIYVSTTQVALDTSAWLAIALGIEPILYDPDKLDQLITAVSRARKPVLIIGSSKVVSALLAKLTMSTPREPQSIEFGDMWAVSASTGDGAKLKARRVGLAGPILLRVAGSGLSGFSSSQRKSSLPNPRPESLFFQVIWSCPGQARRRSGGVDLIETRIRPRAITGSPMPIQNPPFQICITPVPAGW